jgi:hypothetical protein
MLLLDVFWRRTIDQGVRVIWLAAQLKHTRMR